MKRRLVSAAAVLGWLAAAASASPGVAPVTSWADRAYEQSVKLLQDGRRAEAYGRIVALANAGHPDAARLAITMCRHGLQLYGSDWDCAVTELEDWARVSAGPRHR